MKLSEESTEALMDAVRSTTNDIALIHGEKAFAWSPAGIRELDKLNDLRRRCRVELERRGVRA